MTRAGASLSSPAVAPEVTSPPRSAEEVVRAAWREVLGHDGFTAETDFFDVGGDSVGLARVAELVAEELSAMLPIETFFDNPTLESLAAALEPSVPRPEAPPPPAPEPARPRAVSPARSLISWTSGGVPRLSVVGVPPLSGGAAVFREWPSLLPEGIEVLAVRPPGRQSRVHETLSVDVPHVVDEIAEALPRDRAVSLFGYCAGSLIAFELARRLRREGRPLTRLFVAFRGAPNLPSYDTGLHALPHDEFLDRLVTIGAVPEGVRGNQELLRLLEPAMRADFVLIDNYVFEDGPPLDVPITVFVGADDPHFPFDDLAAWRFLTSERFTLRLVEGGHFRNGEAWNPVLDGMLADLDERPPTR